MKRNLLVKSAVITATLLFVAAMLMPSSADAWTKYTYKYSGKSAYAYFSSGSLSASLSVSESMSTAYINLYDYSTNRYGDGYVTLSDFGVSGNIDKAHAAGIGTITWYENYCDDWGCYYNYVGSESVTIDATWTGTGELIHNRSHSHSSSDGYMSNSSYSNTHRDATAKISINGDDMTSINADSYYASIDKVKEGYLTIYKP